MALCDLYGRMGAAPQALIGIPANLSVRFPGCAYRASYVPPTRLHQSTDSSRQISQAADRDSDVFESLPSITIACYHIEGIDAEVDAIDIVFIERKGYRTRDHSAANVYLAAVRDDEHAGQNGSTDTAKSD